MSLLALAWAWLRERAWVRWLVVAAGALIAGLLVYLAGRRDGTEVEHTRQGESNRVALGDTVRGDDALDARTEARATETAKKIEAIDAATGAALAAKPTTDEDALTEAKRMAAEVEAAERSDT